MSSKKEVTEPKNYDEIPKSWSLRQDPKPSTTKLGGTILNSSNDTKFKHRVLVATPSIGTIRMEWALARWGQIIPMNWTMVQWMEYVNSYVPLNYTVPDAQNLIVKHALEQNFEWLILIEDDTAPPPDAFIRFNKYMRERRVPVVSGLYFSRSVPSEPLVFRERGNGVYWDWKQGDLVWCDGVPTGMLLIHTSILREMWKDAPEYQVKGQTTRRIFKIPEEVIYNPEMNIIQTLTGTTDLNWCKEVMSGGYFEKAGWKAYQKLKYPFLVDTNIFCRHIDRDGTQYPTEL